MQPRAIPCLAQLTGVPRPTAAAAAVAAAIAPGSDLFFSPWSTNISASQNISGMVTAPLDATKAVMFFRNASAYPCVAVVNVAGVAVTAAMGGAAALIALAGSGGTVAALSATKALAAYPGASNFLDVAVVDIAGNTPTVGTPLTNASQNSSATMIALSVISPAKAVCVYRNGAGYLSAVVLEISGSTVTKGNVINVVSGDCNHMSVAALSDSQAICTYQGPTGYLNAVILNISGNTVTAGTVLAINSVSSTKTSVVKLTADKAVCTFLNNSTGYVNGVVLSVSGSTITNGVPAASLINGYSYHSLAGLTADRAIQMSGNAPQGHLLSISGTTVGFGPLTTPAGASSAAGFVYVSALSGAKALCTYAGLSGYTEAILFAVV